MRQQLKIMLELQDSMNTKVHSNWREQGFEWYRAIWIECAELMDHYGWKWWKKQAPDIEQVRLELIDIWHFGLSMLLQSGKAQDEIVSEVENSLRTVTDGTDFHLNLEAFVADILHSRCFNVAAFARLMAGINLSFDALYESYVGKNVLNFFRQNHGYKDGTYVKQWDGREDNEHLVEIVQTLDTASTFFKDELYAALKSRYAEVVAR